jgi:hypothetical protein
MATTIDDNLRLDFQVICNLEYRLPAHSVAESQERIRMQMGIDEITRELAEALEKVVAAKVQEMARDR